MWGATLRVAVISAAVGISIHAPRVGRDDTRVGHKTNGNNFNPRAPCGARRYTPYCCFTQNKFQSTRPVWGATGKDLHLQPKEGISIHAPRVGRDAKSGYTLGEVTVFQSTRPVWGATTCILARPNTWRKFQSTRPVWGATTVTMCLASSRLYFNPRAPCGARPCVVQGRFLVDVFQSTRPVWGATAANLQSQITALFQSTRPVWGATFSPGTQHRPRAISIHAPRVGRDWPFLI